MSRPIPVDIIPSHVVLSEIDKATLFGIDQPMTIAADRSQAGQVVYEESVEVFGKLKRSLRLRVLGPSWERSHVELTPTEVAYLGLGTTEESKSGNVEKAKTVRLVGPKGSVEIRRGVIIPSPHLLLSPQEATELHVMHGQLIGIDLISERPKILDGVIVRVHPTFRLRIELHQDYARSLWITRPTHAQIRT